jgi:hypothetical protein
MAEQERFTLTRSEKAQDADALVRTIVDKLQKAGRLTPQPAVAEIFAGERLDITPITSLKEYARFCERDEVFEVALRVESASEQHPGATIVVFTTPGKPLHITPVYLSEALA